MGRFAVKFAMCVLTIFAVAAMPATGSDENHDASVAGLTAELLDAATVDEVGTAVAVSRAAGLTDVQIANAFGRAVAGQGNEIALMSAYSGFVSDSPEAVSLLHDSYGAGETTAGILADYQGITNVPWGGSGGSTGGRNE